MTDISVIQRHTHALRIMCRHPLARESYALLYHLLVHTNTTFFDYRGGPPPPGSEPTSVAQLAVTPNNDHATNAATYVERVFDELYALCFLASYLTGEGDPRYAPPITRYPNAVVLRPSDDIAANELLMRPVDPNPLLRSPDELSEFERTAMTWKPRFRCIIAFVNRFYADPEHRNGAVLGMMFFVLMTNIPEIRNAVQAELVDEGVTEAQCATLFSYVTQELRAFVASNIDYQNAREFWNTVWLSIADTIDNNDFVRMEHAMIARTLEQERLSDELKALTQRKRQSRATGKQRRRRRGEPAPEEETVDMSLMAVLAGIVPAGDDADGANNDDDGVDDTLDDILMAIP